MDRSPSLRPVLAEITVVAFEDPVVEHLGHRPGSAYIELCYLPVLGPSTTWLWQRLSRLAAAAPSTAVDAGDLALSLGLGNGLGAHAPLPRSLSRLVQFDCAYRAGEVFAVRRALPGPAGTPVGPAGPGRPARRTTASWRRGQPGDAEPPFSAPTRPAVP